MANLTIFWFRRDLRLDDNAGLFHALKDRAEVVPLFIFDTDILSKLEDEDDARVSFLHKTVSGLKEKLNGLGSDLLVRQGKPLEVFKALHHEHPFMAVYTNHDYEPAARRRDDEVAAWMQKQGVEFKTFKDQVLFEKDEILTQAGKPYTVFTPYKNKVLATLKESHVRPYPTRKYFRSFFKTRPEKMVSLEDIGFRPSSWVFPSEAPTAGVIKNYAQTRDFPALKKGTSRLGLHLRFGTVSVRKWAGVARKYSEVWLSELIWREFFMQILWHYPHVQKKSFRPEYDRVPWRKAKADFKKWCEGKTGYPLVDAGMRELNATGYMHNRVRMVAASFLCKHLLIHWCAGERYFARKLLDYDLAANNGNWQWAAGSGCDAAPYFRIFNPLAQARKFDPEEEYIKKWIPEYGTDQYPKPIIDHEEARGRCLAAYAQAVRK